MSPEPHSRLLSLPREIRDYIFSFVLVPWANPAYFPHIRYRYDVQLFKVNRQIHHEALEVFKRENVFVRLETPWEAEHHVAIEHHLPIFLSDPKAQKFHHYSLSIRISSPDTPHGISDEDSCKLVFLLEDLAGFAKMWFYTDLTHPGLNHHLRLGLHIKHSTNHLKRGADSRKDMSKTLQRKLIEPFGLVKGLQSFDVTGPHDPALFQAVRKEMAKPPKSPEECLEEATKYKDAGNDAIQDKRFNRAAEAIQYYIKSFEAMHIICVGRRRDIWGSPHFEKQMEGGQYDGQHGQLVRLILRVQLVSNIVLAYLKLEDYKEAHFWGFRTINLFQEAMGNEDDQAMTDFVAASSMGKIYYRTGLACRELGDKPEARRLFRIAADYLPNDQTIKEAMATVALQIG